MPIYTNIKKTCKQKGISVTKLEADLGFARSTIYKYSYAKGVKTYVGVAVDLIQQ